MAKFESKDNQLYIDDHLVIKAWESYTGWFWFAVKKVCEQESDLGDGKGTPDTIWFGYVQGLEEEWGNFSQAEIESLGMKAWRIKDCDLPHAGRRAH